jgi:prepilin-type processing-associated H-X9-DG protein
MPGWTFFTTFRTFQSLSNELVKTEILTCSTDLSRAAATNFAVLQNSNLSYFVGANGTFDKPGSILAGDRSVVSANNLYRPPTVLQAGPGYLLHWTTELHQYQGNVLFADGHVEEWNNAGMPNAENAMPDVENLFLPSIVPTATTQYGGNDGGSGGGGGSGGSGGSGDGGAGGGSGGYNSFSPNAGYSTSSGQSMPSAGYSSPAAQPMAAPTVDQSSPMPRSSAVNNTLSQASAPADSLPPSTNDEADAEVSTSDVATVISPDDSDVGMSQEDKHLTKVLQHTFEWIYFLLLLLMLLYLTYKIRKWMREREARQKAKQERWR